jgi:geranylgeranyl reductase family protein
MSELRQMYDLIVVGAGPAGSSAARTAAQQGLKTLLVEKDRLPRNKLCGGGVTPKVLKLLDFKLPNELIECTTRATRIHVGDKCFSFEHDSPIVYMASRAPFDKFLADKAVEAGVELRDQSPVHQINATQSHVEVKTSQGTFESKMVIGADGMGGPTAFAGGFYDRWKPHQVAYAIESEVPVGERAVEDFIGDQSYFDIFFGVSQAGYGWVFPKDNHLTVGVGCRLSKLRDAHGLFNGFIKRIPELEGADIPKPQAHLIPLGGVAKVPTTKERILLAGDSAGFAEPLLGEGIYFAIWGGQLAARVASEACHQERFDDSFLKRYVKRWRNSFGVDFDVAYRVACFSYLEQYDMDRVARFFFAEKKVQECMVGLMDGTLRYRDIQSKLAWPYVKYRLAKLGLPFYS